jgi:hypothetical protein
MKMKKWAWLSLNGCDLMNAISTDAKFFKFVPRKDKCFGMLRDYVEK